MIFWAKALFDAANESNKNFGEYYDVIERALYNIMLSSVTLQGDSYFYRNPLTSKGDDHHWSWNGCPCCPPMIHKLFGAFNDYIYAVKHNTCYVNLFVSSEAEIKLKNGSLILKQESNYPWSGNIKFTVKETSGSDIKIALRLPNPTAGNNGYKIIENIKTGDKFELNIDMTVNRVQAHPYVRQNRKHVAVQRGPLVYCAEGIDNSGKIDFIIAEEPEFTETYEKDLLGGIITIKVKDSVNRQFKMIPLYAWDNRMACPMRVWFEQENMPVLNDEDFKYNKFHWDDNRRPYRIFY